MKNKKIIITLSIIAILVLTIGITYSIFTTSKTSKNSNLVVGDIYMHYNETNQIQMEGAMPTNPYVVNPIMSSQEYVEFTDDSNELTKCVDYLRSIGMPLNSGDTYITYCQGTGKSLGGKTFQENLADVHWFPDTVLTRLKELNIITNDNKVNPIMTTQEYTKGGTNELTKCVDALVNMKVEAAISLCKGEKFNGITLQQAYDQGFLDQMNLTDTFIQENIIIFNPLIPYFEFTVDGKNTTTNKDIWYEVVLSKGDNIDGKTRIKDNLLRFRLTETKDNKETIVVNNKSYSDLTSKRIWVDTINKNTTSEVVHTYKLYMWISNDTVIGNVNQDYTMEEWKNIFASIKVGVSGDFNEKALSVETSCFTTQENETGLTITDYNSSCGSKIAIPETIDNLKVTQISSNAFNNKGLIYVDIPSSVVKIGAYAFTGNNITSINVPETVTNLHCKAFDDGVVKNRDMTCQETDESCFTAGTINDGNEVAILDYDETCGTDVIIPRKIKGYPVTVIGNSDTAIVKQLSNKNNNYSFNNLNNYVNKKYKINKIELSQGAFYSKNLTSVIIPDSVTTIETNAFSNNQLTSVIIPDSVTTIGYYAFSDNQLTSIVIPDSVTTIKWYAFSNNQLTNVEFSNPSKLGRIEYRAFQNNNISTVSIPETVTYLDCDAFDKNVVITKSDSLVCTNYIN